MCYPVADLHRPNEVEPSFAPHVQTRVGTQQRREPWKYKSQVTLNGKESWTVCGASALIELECLVEEQGLLGGRKSNQVLVGCFSQRKAHFERHPFDKREERPNTRPCPKLVNVLIAVFTARGGPHRVGTTNCVCNRDFKIEDHRLGSTKRAIDRSRSAASRFMPYPAQLVSTIQGRWTHRARGGHVLPTGEGCDPPSRR